MMCYFFWDTVYNIKPVKQMDQAMIVLLSTTNDMSCTATFNTCCSLSIMDCGIGVPGCWGSSKHSIVPMSLMTCIKWSLGHPNLMEPVEAWWTCHHWLSVDSVFNEFGEIQTKFNINGQGTQMLPRRSLPQYVVDLEQSTERIQRTI